MRACRRPAGDRGGETLTELRDSLFAAEAELEGDLAGIFVQDGERAGAYVAEADDSHVYIIHFVYCRWLMLIRLFSKRREGSVS